MPTPDPVEREMSSPTVDLSTGLRSDGTIRRLSVALGYDFADPTLLELALRHRSWCSEHGGAESNERLEFLGDAVLGLVVTDHLYATNPGLAEGVLARCRSELVNARVLARIAEQLDLGSAVLLGRGEDATGGREKTSILADAMEAVFGAVYLDGGIEAAGRVVLGLLGPAIERVTSGDPGTDYKSLLQELVVQTHDEVPRYELSEAGPDHDKWFEAVAWIGEVAVGRGGGRSKKQAEQAAAGVAWRSMTEAAEQSRPESEVGHA